MKQGITAVAFLHHKGKLLVAKRAATLEFLPGIYELPGGHIEFGESMEEGLAREIKEEFGIDILVGDPFYVFTYTDDDKTKHIIEVVYFALMKDLGQKIHLNSNEHSEYQWIRKIEVEKILMKQNAREGKAALRGFKTLEGKN